MGQIPREFVNELLARVDIVALINQQIPLKKAGSNYSACCPFHSEKTPSFTVSQSKQFYHCFGCGAHGNAIGFLMNHQRLEFVEAVEALAAELTIPMPQLTLQKNPPATQPLLTLLEKAQHFYQAQLTRSPKAQAYLHNRGLSSQILEQFHIGLAPDSWDSLAHHFPPQAHRDLIETGMLIKGKQGKTYDRFRNRILFPIRDLRGRIIGFGGRSLTEELPKYLNSPETPLFHKASELYGFYESVKINNDFKQIIVVEGYMDVISLHQHGITEAVGTLGTAIGPKHLQRILRQCPRIIFCFDGDSAGDKACWRALEISLEMIHDGHEMRFMFLPAGEDPDSLVQKEGGNAFRARMEQATPLADFFFSRLSRDINLDSIEGKAKLAAIAKNLIQKISNGVFQQLMMDKLATLLGMQIHALEQLTSKPHVKAPNPSLKQLNPMQLALALLLQYPELGRALTLSPSWADIKVPGSSILKKMIELIHMHPNISTGALLEHWRNTKAAQQLADMAIRDLIIPATGAADELKAALEKIVLVNQEQKIQQLISKSHQTPLSDQEKGHLLDLIREGKQKKEI